jgi:pyruvate/2-oxoglutarate dehydrogenase complex dihydrolipoamide dehydrogenase (E3) component
MSSAQEADLVVIGSGQGGVPLAVAWAKRGHKTVLIERGRFGGTCLNTGCTPSKTLLAAAHAAGRARGAGPLGVHAEVTVDQRAVFARIHALRDRWSNGAEERLVHAGVEIVRASAAFVAERTVAAGGRTFVGKRVVIDTGGYPAVPPIQGLAGTPYFTNLNFFDPDVLPPRLAVIGGGYIGLELGQGAQRIGAAVTIINNSDEVMEREEADAAAVVRESLEADGVKILRNAKTQSVAYDGGTFTVMLGDGTTVEAEGLLVATGRKAQTADLALEAAGIARDARGSVQIDDYLRTACDGVYAIGEAAGQPAFTHVSYEDYRRLLSTFDGTPRRRDDRVLSYTTFTEPQLARTGMDLPEAQRRGIAARAVTLPLTAVARAVEWNLTDGFFRLVVDTANDRVLGATFVGYEAGEIIHAIIPYIEAQMTWRAIERAMHIHPTLSEGIPSLAALLEQPAR